MPRKDNAKSARDGARRSRNAAPPPHRPNGSGRDVLGRILATVESIRRQLAKRRENRSRLG